MANTTLSIGSRRNVPKGPGDRGRRILAVALVLVTAAAAYLVFTRDISWERRNQTARSQGLSAAHNGNFPAARDFFRIALANHPYDWRTHFNLANILAHRLDDPEGALKHYLYTLAYSPESTTLTKAREEVDILKLMRAGELENPVDALGDMFDCADGGARALFERRINPQLLVQAQATWQGWRERERGKITNVRVRSKGENFYDAYVEVEYPDRSRMSMHFSARLRDIWRLSLSFP